MDQYLVETLPHRQDRALSEVADVSIRCANLEHAIASADRARREVGIRTEIDWQEQIAVLRAGEAFRTKFISGAADVRVTKLNGLGEPVLEPEDAERVKTDYLFQIAVQDFSEALSAKEAGNKAGYIANCQVMAGNGARDLASKLSLPIDVILPMVHAEGRRRFEDESDRV